MSLPDLVIHDKPSAAQRRSWSEREYLTAAESYAARDESIWRNPTGTANALHALVERTRPLHVLELGTGTGRYFPFLTGERYVGVDICPAMLRFARTRSPMLRDRGFAEISLIEEEVTDYLAETMHSGPSFDLIFSIGCIGYHVPVDTTLLERVAALLAPGGFLFLQTTQQSVQWRIRAWCTHRIQRLFGQDDDYGFFVSTNERQLRRLAAAVELETEWILEDSRRFFDMPLLLSCFRKPAVD